MKFRQRVAVGNSPRKIQSIFRQKHSRWRVVYSWASSTPLAIRTTQNFRYRDCARPFRRSCVGVLRDEVCWFCLRRRRDDESRETRRGSEGMAGVPSVLLIRRGNKIQTHSRRLVRRSSERRNGISAEILGDWHPPFLLASLENDGLPWRKGN